MHAERVQMTSDFKVVRYAGSGIRCAGLGMSDVLLPEEARRRVKLLGRRHERRAERLAAGCKASNTAVEPAWCPLTFEASAILSN